MLTQHLLITDSGGNVARASKCFRNRICVNDLTPFRRILEVFLNALVVPFSLFRPQLFSHSTVKCNEQVNYPILSVQLVAHFNFAKIADRSEAISVKRSFLYLKKGSKFVIF